MKATQSAIAKLVGLDVSSVNKILNKVPGAKFHEDTIRLVRAAAKELRYENRKTKGAYLRALIETRTALARLADEVAELPREAATGGLAYAFHQAKKVLLAVPT